MKNRFDLIIFDWDGTLMDSISWIVSCLQQAAKACQCNIPGDQAARDVIGLSLKNALMQLFPEVDNKTHLQLTANYSEHFLSRPASRDDLFDGIDDVLNQLRNSGYQLAVATGKTRIGLDRALQGTGIGDLFSATRCADETSSKPDPMMVREIIEQLGIDSDRALMVGDSLHDLQMAKNANIPSIGVACGVHSADTLRRWNPLLCLNQTTEILELL